MRTIFRSRALYLVLSNRAFRVIRANSSSLSDSSSVMWGPSKGEWFSLGTDIETGAGGDSFEKDVRLGFIRKVFGILSLQLLLTASIGGIILGVHPVRNWIFNNIWVLWIVIFLSLGFVIALSCMRELARRYPMNLILLFSFTGCEGLLLGTISATYDFDDVVLAVGITVGVTVALTLFALQTKIDFTLLGGVLFACLVAVVLTSFVFAIYPSNGVPATIFAGLGALLFSVYLVYDVQLIAGGRKYQLDTDDYVLAALMVYLDIINLFLMTLRLISSRN